MLKIAASGLVAYCACSPACCQYSRLKLRPGGPPALRTPEHLDGVPGPSSEDLAKVQESNLMLERSVQLLQVFIAAGGHGHLEQPSPAMSWEEPAVRAFIHQHACACVYIAACGYGNDWHKSWLLACTYQALQSLAFKCPHQPGDHQAIRGTKMASGQCLSRITAEYPQEVSVSWAQIVSSLVSHNKLDLVGGGLNLIPEKAPDAQPFCRQDGAGLVS